MIPEPDQVQISGKKGFEIVEGTRLVVLDSELMHPAEMLADALLPSMGYLLPVVTDTKPSRGDIIFQMADSAEMKMEAYLLHVDNRNIEIITSSASGAFYGGQTLRQLLPVEIFAKEKAVGVRWMVPPVRIKDEPRFQWRGMLLDVGRYFFGTEDVKAFLDEMAMHKYNTFHWHLTEDQGWRIEIRKYPLLTEIGAWRDETLIGHNRERPRKYDGKTHGGFYTQDEIREIVKYAADRYIEIVPEIEMPGHSQAAIASYPEYGVTGDNPGVKTEWGVSSNIYMPSDETIDYLKDVLSEVLDLFPGTFIHIGGDEAPKQQWDASPEVKRLLKERGLEDMHEMQSWFIKQIDVFLNEQGRRLIGWDEILEGGLAEGATVMSWRGEDGGIEAARQGHDVVMASNKNLYLNYYQVEDHENEPLAIGGYIPLSKVYLFEPIPEELNEEEAIHIIGAQGQIWTEYIDNRELMEYMLFPRMCALSEVLWKEKGERDYDDFLKRWTIHSKRLDHAGINCRKEDHE